MFSYLKFISDYFTNYFKSEQLDIEIGCSVNKDAIILNKLINIEKNIKKLNKKIDKLHYKKNN